MGLTPPPRTREKNCESDRFLDRIHENNTVCLVLTFLIYHTSPTFLSLLSILPKTLPPTLKFLHPYIESLTSPPRHTIVYTVAHDPKFYSIFSGYVLDLYRSGYQFEAISTFWATITTESVAAMLDQSRSGRPAVQKEIREGLVLRVMPMLNEGLAMKSATELQIGCFMVLTFIATKMSLSDQVLDAAMEAVVSNWSQVTASGLICLATLAEQREMATLPHKVLKALLALGKLDEELMALKSRIRVDGIVLGVVLGLLGRLGKPRYLGLVRSLLESKMMNTPHLTIAIAGICAEVQEPEKSADTKDFLTDLLYSLAKDKDLQPIIKSATDENGLDLPLLTGNNQNLVPTSDNDDEHQRQLKLTSKVTKEPKEPRALEIPETVMDEAPETTLRTVPLSTAELQSSLDSCLELLRKFQNDSNASKRRRTNHGSVASATSHDAEILLKQLTTTLELVETSKPGKHPGLMKGLFQILAELQNSRSHFGTEMGYLQVVALENIHAIVKEAEVGFSPAGFNTLDD